MNDLQEVRPGLFRWTALHPDAEQDPKPGSPADWGPEVGSVAWVGRDALVLVDPLVPADRPELQRELDDLVRSHRRPVAILTTLKFHRRSRPELAERYGASTSRARASLPPSVVTVPIRGAGETMIWLPDLRTLVPGDRLLGEDAGGLRLCPDSWLRYLPSGMRRDALAEALRPLLDLPVESVVVSHGEAVLENGRDAIAQALAIQVDSA